VASDGPFSDAYVHNAALKSVVSIHKFSKSKHILDPCPTCHLATKMRKQPAGAAIVLKWLPRITKISPLILLLLVNVPRIMSARPGTTKDCMANVLYYNL
jgi:hypothetical protein